METALRIVVGFSLLFVVAGALPAYLAVCGRCAPERSMLPVFLGHLALLALAASFGAAPLLFGAAAVVDLLLFGAALRRMRREAGAWRRFLTPRIAAAWIFLAFFGVLTMSRRFAFWDEFSHWGPAARMLFEYGRLNCDWRMLSHGSYPPGLPVAVDLVLECFAFPRFSEAAAIFATAGVFVTLCLVDLLPTAEEGARPGFLRSAGELLLFNGIVDLALLGFSRSAMADAALGCLFAAGIRRVFAARSRSAGGDLSLALIVGFLPMVKDAGLLCALMVQFLYLLRRIGGNGRSGGAAPGDSFRDRAAAAAVFAAPWIFKAFWTLLLRLRNTAIRFPAGRLSPAAMAEALAAPGGEWRREVLRAFLLRSLREALPLLAAVLLVLWLRRRRDPATYRFLAAVPLCWIAFGAGLAAVYLFEFTVAEARSLASFDRYLGGFALAWLLSAAALAAEMLPPDLPRGKIPRFCAAAVTALLALAWFRGYWMAHRVWFYRMGYLDRLTELDCRRIDRDYGALLAAPGTTFRLVESAGGGESTYRLAYAYPFAFERFPIFYPRRAPTPEEFNAVRMTPEELFAYGSACRYLLAGRVDARFLRDYGELFPGLSAEGCLLFEADPSSPGRFRAVAKAR